MILKSNEELHQSSASFQWSKRDSIEFIRFLAEKNIPSSKQSYYLRWAKIYTQHSRENVIDIHLKSTQKSWIIQLQKQYMSPYLIDQAQSALNLFIHFLNRKRTVVGPNTNTQYIQPPPFAKAAKSTKKENKDVDPHISHDLVERRAPFDLKSFANQAIERLDCVLKTRHYSKCTIKAYRYWVKQFFQYLQESQTTQAPQETDVENYLSYLAIQRQVSASSQNQAFNALLFLYRWVLKQDLGKLKSVARAKQKKRIPVVLSSQEIQQIFQVLEAPYRLVVQLLYGIGLRISEALSLRIQDLDFERMQIHVFRGKGKKDRVLPLPKSLASELQAQIQEVKAQWQEDLKQGFAGVFIDDAYRKKHPNAGLDLAWQWLFPALKLTQVDGKRYRYHLHETHVGRAIQNARQRAGIIKRITAHTFRHSYATHLLQKGVDILTIQKLLGHSDIRTTMVYLHTLPSQNQVRILSPLDF